MSAGTLMIAPFESEKHSLVRLVCDFRDKAYPLIRCEAKSQTNAPEMLCSPNGVVK